MAAKQTKGKKTTAKRTARKTARKATTQRNPRSVTGWMARLKGISREHWMGVQSGMRDRFAGETQGESAPTTH